jgi:hypothetical protein
MSETIESPGVVVSERDSSGFMGMSTGAMRGADNSGWAKYLKTRKAAEYAGKYLAVKAKLAEGKTGGGGGAAGGDSSDPYATVIGKKYTWFPEYELEPGEQYEYDDDVACGFSILFEMYNPTTQIYSVSLFVEYDSSITGAPELLEFGQDGKTIGIKLEIDREYLVFTNEGIELRGKVGKFLETYGRLMLWSVLYTAKTVVEENYKENPIIGRNHFVIHDEFSKIFVGMITVNHDEDDIRLSSGFVIHDDLGHVLIDEQMGNIVIHTNCNIPGDAVIHDDLGHIIVGDNFDGMVDHSACSEDGTIVIHDGLGHVIVCERPQINHGVCNINGVLVIHDDLGHVIVCERPDIKHAGCNVAGCIVCHDELGHVIIKERPDIKHTSCNIAGCIVLHDDLGHIVVKDTLCGVNGSVIIHDDLGHIIMNEHYAVTVNHGCCTVVSNLILHDEFGHIIVNYS